MAVRGRTVNPGVWPASIIALAHLHGKEVTHSVVRVVSDGDGSVHGVVVDDQFSDKYSAGLGLDPETSFSRQVPTVAPTNHGGRPDFRIPDYPDVCEVSRRVKPEGWRHVYHAIELETQLVRQLEKEQGKCRGVEVSLDTTDVVAGALGPNATDLPFR